MAPKRITRAEVERGMELITSRLQELDEYAGDVQARVRAELGALSIPPQHERVTLENDEKRNEHYKKVTEILTTRASKDAEACIPEADTLQKAEWLLTIRTAELARLKLEKTDPELDERQWQMLADLKARLVEYPTFLGEVTGDQTFLQSIKKSYESKLEELDEAIDKLSDDVYTLQETCSSRVETSLEKFAEQTMKPAISIVSAQHERLEKELGEAEMRIEKMEAQAGDAGTEKKRLEDEIVELKKILEAEREVKKTQNEEHKRETIDLRARHEKARTIAAEEANSLRADISSYVVAAQELNEDKEELEDSVKRWREQNDSRREELNQLRAKLRTKEGELREAQSEVDSVKEGLQKARDEAVLVDERAEQEKESLRTELKAVKEARNSADAQIQSISSQLATARNEIDSLRELKARDVRSYKQWKQESAVMIGNVSTGLEELSAKFQQFQPSTNEALQELTVAPSKARGDAALQQSIRHFEANKAKRGLGPISPEKPVSKHRRQARQRSVGAAGMLPTFGPPEPLPEDIAERIPSPRGLGRVVRAENTRPEVGSPPPLRRRTGTSGGLNLLDSSTGSQPVLREQASSSMDPATATEQTASEHAATSMPATSSPGTLLQSSQSTVSATAPKGLEEATDEVKDVWRQIEFPENWDLSASDALLRGLKKNIGKGVPKHFRPAGLLDSSSAKPVCVIRRLHKISSKIDNEDGKRCSTCKKFDAPCTQACFVTADLAKVAYNAQGQEKRWKLKIRED